MAIWRIGDSAFGWLTVGARRRYLAALCRRARDSGLNINHAHITPPCAASMPYRSPRVTPPCTWAYRISDRASHNTALLSTAVKPRAKRTMRCASLFAQCLTGRIARSKALLRRVSLASSNAEPLDRTSLFKTPFHWCPWQSVDEHTLVRVTDNPLLHDLWEPAARRSYKAYGDCDNWVKRFLETKTNTPIQMRSESSSA